MKNQTILSGVKPSGVPTLGNYIGVVSQWLELQKNYQTCLFPVVDLHAITVQQDPRDLTENSYLVAALFVASGIDYKKSPIFLQSAVPAHTELAWLLTTISNMGELSRMTQYKDKVQKLSDKESIGTGLFTYPVLMAADILLYGTHVVPVGDDQKQHVELARDLADRFNKRYGKTFVIPQPLIRSEGARIMDLQDPSKKMSKSDDGEKGYILITDTAEIIRKKIMSATTDSVGTIKFDPDRKGITNLLNIYKVLSGKTEKQIEKHFEGAGYGTFKAELADLIIQTLEPIQTKMSVLLKDKNKLDKILADGAKRANKIALPQLSLAKKRIGLVVRS